MVSGGGAGNITNVSYQYYALSGQNCLWSNGTGSGSCERDWSIAEQCMGLNRTGCTGDCLWTNDTWCDGTGAGSEWCNNQGGWCDHEDFAPKNCWQSYDNSSCSVIEGCSWRTDQYSTPHCEVNWSGNCWQYSSNGTCSAGGCSWKTDSWGSWCDNSMSACWSYTTEGGCNAVSGGICSWRNYGGGGGTCEPSCYGSTSSSSCSAVSGCVWKEESGWCEEQQSQSCYNTTNSNDEVSCAATTGCRWNSPGWCSPKDGFSAGSGAGGGGGGGGAMGGNCYKYDGNQALCTNASAINISCGWSVNQNPSCEPNWGRDCWSYTSVEGGCNATNGCWFKNDSYGSWCGNIVDQCWNNVTLVENATLCNANPYCNSTGYGCSSACSTLTTEDSCGGIANSACRWTNGWCNPAGMNDIFDGMEGGAPVPLSGDLCDGSETSQASVDICGLGMKDMGDSYGFGANVRSFINASVCNKEMVGQPMPGAVQQEGSGNETVKYTVYLDTDGSTSDGCALDNNVSAEGYEFKLRYSSEWSASASKATETFTSYKCDNSQWKISDLKISAWKKIMCSDIGGPMIAVEKSELSRFPTLYDSSADIRVYASTIGNTGNLSSPSDVVGPGWATPGSADFEIFDAFSYGADTAKFEDILKKGFVQGEDCFTSADDDNDGLTNCLDYDCQFASSCGSTGVNAAGYSDTSAPLVTGVKIEEYNDGGLIMYDSNKPTNGTLEFYRNDSQCTTLNKTIHDVGITSSHVRDYKLWHKADIYSSTLGYALTNDTTYYYKIKVCDDENKCAVSRCSSFITASSSNKCWFCNFVARIKVGSGWTVSYDINQDATYEHIQGAICGSTAGMKANYTMRNVNIKLAKNDGTTYFEFVNASLTKTGLNDKVRTISSLGDVIGTSTYAGLSSETRDKIINNLNPEICRVKVPNSGTCTTLYHCDDNGENCVDRTSAATLVDSTNCVWQVPNCEFSTYKTNAATVVNNNDDGGGGGGGGGGGAATATTPSEEDSTTSEGSDSGTEGSDAGAEQQPSVPEFSPQENTNGFTTIFIATLLGMVILAGIVIGIVFGIKHRKVKRGY